MSSSSNDDDSVEIKAILIGNSGVGKTNLINVCIGEAFDPETKPSTSCALVQKILMIDKRKYVINLWDTMGQEVYKGMSQLFFRDSQIVFFVYDITSKESFDGLEEWIKMANEIIDNDFISGIMGNKNDLYLNSSVTEEEAKSYADSKKMKLKFVSAKEDPKSFEDFLLELAKEVKVPERRKKTILKKENMNKKKKKCSC